LLFGTVNKELLALGSRMWQITDISNRMGLSYKSKLTTEEINKLLLGRLADRGKSETLQKLWDCAKGNLTEDEFKVLLLNTDIKERYAWHWAAERVKSETLKKPCE